MGYELIFFLENPEAFVALLAFLPLFVPFFIALFLVDILRRAVSFLKKPTGEVDELEVDDG